MDIKNISGKEFKKMIEDEKDNLEIVDVREKAEYDLIKIKNSKLIPLSQIGSRIDEIDWSKKVVLVCRSGSRSGYVASMLVSGGKKVANLENGIYELYLNDCDCLEKDPECCKEYF